MNSTGKDEKELDIEKLTEILSKIQNVYYRKQEQLEELQLQISEMKEIINTLNFLISKQSFHSADELYLEKVQELERKPNSEEIAKELEMRSEDVAYALKHAGRHISVDAPFTQGDDNKNSLWFMPHIHSTNNGDE